MTVSDIKKNGEKIIENVEKVIVGKRGVLSMVLTALLSGGHVLLEDMPGTGKTTLAKALARSMDVDCTRVQFTPDLLPSDLTGINFYNQKLGEFSFRKGPLFTNLLLADEINRATPRTQSSLLESMEEATVTVDSVTYRLERPYFVIATQNPIETQGTFPLPEAQLDRFFMKLSMGYLERGSEIEMLSRGRSGTALDGISAVVTGREVCGMQEAVREVEVSDDVKGYIVDITHATRENPNARLGVSPRGSLALMRGAQAYAALEGRGFVTPDDVKAVAPAILSHRIVPKGGAALRSAEAGAQIVAEALAKTAVPTEKAEIV